MTLIEERLVLFLSKAYHVEHEDVACALLHVSSVHFGSPFPFSVFISVSG